MIQMLRGNARKRPSLKRGYPRLHERDIESGVKINYRKIRALTDQERLALRKKIELEKKLKSRKSILAIAISIVLVMLLFWGLNFLFHNHAETNPIY
jgi:hypothetical protein